MSRIVLHIGSHKTGTTSIQRFLDVAANEVEAATGLRYVALRRDDIPAIDRHLDRADELRTRGARVRQEYIDHLAAQDTDCLVVEEDLSWVFDREEIASFLDRLAGSFSDIAVVAYVRRQDRHLVSHYQQAAHFQLNGTVFFGTRPSALPAPSPHHDRYLDYSARLAPYVERLGRANVTVRVFESDQLTGADAVTDFLGVLGVERDRIAVDTKRFNESMGKVTTKLGHLYNELPDRRVRSWRLATVLPAEPKLMPARRDAEAVAERYAESNVALAERFGLRGFATTFDDYPEQSNDDWTAPEVVEAIVGIRRLVLRIGRRQGHEIAPGDVFGPDVRALRRAAEAGRLPPPVEIDAVLTQALRRLNDVEAGIILHPPSKS